MNHLEIVAIQEIVSIKKFVAGAQEHVDGLAGYVRDFLAEHGGERNDQMRDWTVESCADALKIPPKTLRRWLDQGKPAAVPTAKAEQVKVSHARSALRDPVQRRAVVESLPTDVRDELKADLIEHDVLDVAPESGPILEAIRGTDGVWAVPEPVRKPGITPVTVSEVMAHLARAREGLSQLKGKGLPDDALTKVIHGTVNKIIHELERIQREQHPRAKGPPREEL